MDTHHVPQEVSLDTGGTGRKKNKYFLKGTVSQNDGFGKVTKW
jgi:hypothetical protein